MNVSNIWFYETGGHRTGPVSLQVIRSLSRKGIITKTTLVSEGTQDNWVPFSDVEGRLTPTVSTVATTPNTVSNAVPSAIASTGAVPQFSSASGQPAVNLAPAAPLTLSPSQAGVTGFGEAISVCFAKYFDFSGRANRAEYWYFQLFTILVNLLILLIIGLTASALTNSSLIGVLPLVSLVFQLALFIPILSVSARRLHDTDKSAWWLLIGLVPLIGAIVLIVFFCQRGTLVANRYG